MGNQFSGLPSGFEPGVDSWYGVLCTNFHFVPDFRDPETQEYFLLKWAYTGSFIALLLVLSWWHGQSSFERRPDPVEAANKERDAAIKACDDAQRAWGTMHKRAMETNLELQNELGKASKDLPWLEQKHYELAEENCVQHNEIEHLKYLKQGHDELLAQVESYGMSAKQPEYYQQQSEKLQRELDIATNLLNKSEKCVEALKEALDTQLKKRDAEKEWLQARLKKNSRSPAYWAKHRLNNHKLEPKPAWGVRCACTEPERGYSLKDQSSRIVELEAAVAARDLTITRLRESRLIYVRKNDTSTSNAINSSLPSAESSGHDSSSGSQIATTTLVHACEHEEHCKNLGNK